MNQSEEHRHDLQGHFLGNYHAKDLKPRIEREKDKTTSEESNVDLEDRDSVYAKKTRVVGSPKEVSTPPASQQEISKTIIDVPDQTTAETSAQVLPRSEEPTPIQITHKRGPGRPRKEKRGRPRKTILAPRA